MCVCVSERKLDELRKHLHFWIPILNWGSKQDSEFESEFRIKALNPSNLYNTNI